MPVAIRQLDSSAAGFDAELGRVLQWSAEADREIEERVAAILDDVRARGDAAVLDYTQRFDGLRAESVAALEIPAAELQAALRSIPIGQRNALEAAARRVRDFHERQLDACGRSWSYRDADGTLLGQKVTPLDRVGIYVPGGKAAYPSSVLMNALPAQVAGVGEIVMVVPTPVRGAGADGIAAHAERNPLVLAAAAVAGVHR
ncbi:MAG: histidinol dehydrogenase, partial [Caldimonas sp.]